MVAGYITGELIKRCIVAVTTLFLCVFARDHALVARAKEHG